MSSPHPGSTFRADIEGLRAVAILFVLLFHFGLPLTGGYIGVDVFFVISGFLITGLLLREAEREGRISLTGFYARRARRLLPAACLVLLVSSILVPLIGPVTQRETFALDISAAAGYVANWRFAWRSVDYLAEDVGPSPVLHFWSLSVEEQFYLVWPLLIVAALSLGRRFRWRPRVVAGIALAGVTGLSLCWSIAFTQAKGAEAFFVSSTRIWELGVGALLAIWLGTSPDLRSSTRQCLAWSGFVAVLVGGIGFDDATSWPGAWALFPCLGTASLIASNGSGPIPWPSRVLSWPPLVAVGSLSYSLYLWHWPVLVVGRSWLGLHGAHWGAFMLLLTVGLAWGSYRWVEEPVRHSKLFQLPALSLLSLGLNLTFLSVLAGFAIVVLGRTHQPTEGEPRLDLIVEAGEVRLHPAELGAGALREHANAVPETVFTDGMQYFPNALDANQDVPSAYERGCQAGFKARKPTWCSVGDVASEKRIVLAGDSKILQYFDAFDAVGRALGLKVEVATKSSCAFSETHTTNGGKPYPECLAFNRTLLREILNAPPWAVVTSQSGAKGFPTAGARAGDRSSMISGLVDYWSHLEEAGIRVIVLIDNPHPPRDLRPIVECVSRHPGRERANCSFDRTAGLDASAAGSQWAAAQKLPVDVIDLTDYICPGDRCPPIVGQVLVYRQTSHLTNTYARSLAPQISRFLSGFLDGG